MDNAANDLRIDYIEFTVPDVRAARKFYETVFGWAFTDYGPEYTSFNDGRLSGGFRTGDTPARGGTLIVLYARNLDDIKARVTSTGGTIVQDTFEFPGGRRFHFTDPGGNELAVWSE